MRTRRRMRFNRSRKLVVEGVLGQLLLEELVLLDDPRVDVRLNLLEALHLVGRQLLRPGSCGWRLQILGPLPFGSFPCLESCS